MARILLLTVLLGLGGSGWGWSGHVALPRCRGARRPAPRLALDDDTASEASAEEDATLAEALRLRLNSDEFNNELYDHLAKRPEYEAKDFYATLRQRVDVEDPIYSELKERREMLSNAPQPSPTQAPGEVIEIVLRALRDVDWPRPGHGVELLMNYSGPASILGGADSSVTGAKEITPEMLLQYFASSKYSLLLDWVSITYLKKLDLSADKKRALQQLKLTSANGQAVPVTFQLSKHAGPDGEMVWLIDQLLVKSIE